MFKLVANKTVIDALQTAVEGYKRMKHLEGSTNARRGLTWCHSTSDLLFDGNAGGGHHLHTGAGANYSPYDPQWASATTLRARCRVSDTQNVLGCHTGPRDAERRLQNKQHQRPHGSRAA